ncbi:MAG: hypothetical protein M4579_003719 [Chaenotheca gracillima]|nr:MAG: hypothetical protein M4579_003719 [Chaenotheca gracillima]
MADAEVVELGDAQFDQIWSEAYAEATKSFSNIAGKYLKGNSSLQKPVSVSDLLQQLDTRQQGFSHSREGHSRFTGVMKVALKPIELLGSLASGVAGMAFPPASLCFNAISYLIQTGHQVSASYDAIAELFGRITDFITRFKVYARQKMSQELKKIVHKVLISLIKICALSVRLLKHGAVGEWLKTFAIGRDEKVQVELDNLKGMTETEGAMVGALTLEEVIKSGKGIEILTGTVTEVRTTVINIDGKMDRVGGQVNQIVQAYEKKEKDDNDKKRLKNLEDRLDPSTQKDTLETFRALSRNRLPETGDWIRQEALFKAWLNGEEQVLTIEGDDGVGKSYLAANIISLLQDRYPQGSGEHSWISVVYYFFKSNTRDLRSLSKALRTMAFQVAHNDVVYRNHLDTEFKFPLDSESPQELWQRLFTRFYGSQQHQNTLYMVVDGLDQALPAERLQLLELLREFRRPDGSRLRIQMLLLERPPDENLIEEVLDASIPRISMTSGRNSNDINTYVKTSIENNKTLRATSQNLREEIIQSLTEGSDGNFTWVDMMIKDLKAKRREGQIRAALTQSPKFLPDIIQRSLDRLSDELGEEDIADLNEMLEWVISAKTPLSLRRIDEAMNLKNGEGGSLVPLEDQLRKSYASLFNLVREDGLSTDDLLTGNLSNAGGREADQKKAEDHERTTDKTQDSVGPAPELRSDPQTTKVELASPSIISLFQRPTEVKTAPKGVRLEEAEVKIVQRFLSLVCDKELWDKFEFEDFFQQKRRPKTAVVDVDIARANFKIVTRCLQLICSVDPEDPPAFDEEVDESSLLHYAKLYVPDHIADANLAVATSDEKDDIGRLLLQMFQDETTIRNWLHQSPYVQDDWLYKDVSADKTRDWFQDSELNSAYAEPYLEWAKSLASDSDKHVMQNVVMVAAKEWLQHDVWSPMPLFLLVNAFTNVMESRKGDIERITADPPWVEIETSTILAAANWADLEENAMWFARMGSTYVQCRKYDDAVEMFQKAQDLDSKYWLASLGLIEAHTRQGNWDLALTALENSKSSLQENASAGQTVMGFLRHFPVYESESEPEKYHLDDVAKLYQEVSQLSPFDFTLANSVLQVLADQQRHADIIIHMQEMKEITSPGSGLTKLTEFYHFHVDTENLHGITARAGQESANLDVVRDAYIDAIEAAKTKGDPAITCLLQYWYGLLLKRQYADEDSAAQMWEAVMTVEGGPNVSWQVSVARLNSAKKLCMVYFERARKSGAGTPDAEVNIEKLKGLLSSDGAAIENVDYDTGAFSRTSSANLLLGLYYRLTGKIDEARDCFKTHIKLGLDLLSDDDPTNDFRGYIQLAEVLIYDGDDVNALAAWSALGPREIEVEEAEDEVDEGQEAEHEDEDGESGEKEEEGGEGGRDDEDAPESQHGDGEDQTKSQNDSIEQSDINELSTKDNAAADTTTTLGVPDQNGQNLSELKKDLGLDESAVVISKVEVLQSTVQVDDAKPEQDGQQIAQDDQNGPVGEVAARIVAQEDDDAVGGSSAEGNQVASEESPPQEEEEEDDPSKDEGPFVIMTCDGPCAKNFTTTSDLYFCRYCLEVCFNEECMELFKAGTLPAQICNPSHDFLHVPKATSRLPKDTIKVREELVPVSEWLQTLRTEWRL